MDLSVHSLRRWPLLLGSALFVLACWSGTPSRSGQDGTAGAGATSGAGGDLGDPAGTYGGLIVPCTASMTPVDEVLTVLGVDVTLDAWNACLDTGDCTAICQEKVESGNNAVSGTRVMSCQRFDPPPKVEIHLVGTQYFNCVDDVR